MKSFAVADSETDPFKYNRTPEPFVWGFYDGDNYEHFDNTQDFAKYLSDYSGVVYFHNGGRFDIFFLLPFCDLDSVVMLINGRIAKIKLGKCELRDSFNILPIPLAGYQKDSVDYGIFEKDKRCIPANKKIIEDYLYTDCKYLFELVSAFIDKHGMKLTQAGAAMALYQQMTGTEVPHSDAEYFELFRPFYYGGRVQCFEKGIKNVPFQVFDINSAYPAAMLYDHPSTLDFKEFKGTLDYAEENPQAFFIVTGCTKGAFPFREKVGSKNIYPSDSNTRTFYVSGWEVRNALRCGLASKQSLRVEKIYHHVESCSFSDYILPLFDERMIARSQGNKAGDILAKLLMNSLYGKFGSDPSNYNKSMIVSDIHIPDLQMEGMYHNNHRYYFNGSPVEGVAIASRDLEDWEKNYYNVATAASITGYVRAFLMESLHKVKGAMYCDTDSIACEDGMALALSDKLGDWKHEGNFERAAIAGRKLYTFYAKEGLGKNFTAKDLKDDDKKGWGKIASKGALLYSNDIEKICQGEKITYEQDAPTFSVSRGVKFTKRDLKMLAD